MITDLIAQARKIGNQKTIMLQEPDSAKPRGENGHQVCRTRMYARKIVNSTPEPKKTGIRGS